MDLQQAKNALTVPTVVLKIIPDVDGTVRIAELVRFEYSVTVKGAWTGPGGVDLFHHAAVPVAALPVREIVSVAHTYTDSWIGTSEVVYDYMSEAFRSPDHEPATVRIADSRPLPTALSARLPAASPIRRLLPPLDQ